MENIDLQIYESSGYTTIFTIKDADENPIQISGYMYKFTFYDRFGTVLLSFVDTDTQTQLTGVIGEIQIILTDSEISTLKDGFYVLDINDGSGFIPILTGNISIIPLVRTNIEYLLPFVRLKIGDINPASYRYTDEWLIKALILGMKALQKYWNFKYLISDDNIISRNTNSTQFVFPEPPLIESGDEYIIVLMASIVTLEGSLESSAWDLSSWSDAEIRYTNLDSGRAREGNLKRLIDELNNMILPPTKRLARAKKLGLPGYKDNPWEHKTDY